MQELRGCVISSVVTLFVALAILATMMILLSFVFMTELGLRPAYISILRMALWAMVFNATSMLCFTFLLYFDLRRSALLGRCGERDPQCRAHACLPAARPCRQTAAGPWSPRPSGLRVTKRRSADPLEVVEMWFGTRDGRR